MHRKNKIKKIKKINYWTDFNFAKNELVIASVIFVFVFIVYILTFCKMFYFDALMFASEMVREPHAWANHFSFCFYGNVFWKFLKYTNLIKIVETSPPDGYQTLQVMNTLFSSLTVSFLFLWLKKLTVKTWVSITFSLLLAFSFAFWWRATDAHVYPPSVFHIFVSLWLAWSYMRFPNKTKLLILAISTGLTVLIHQGNVFLVPAMLAGVLYVKKERVKRFVLFSIVTGFIVAVPYLWALSYQERILLTRDGHWNINRKTIFSSVEWLSGNADFIRPDGTINLKEHGYLEFFNLKNMTSGNIKMLMGSIWYGTKGGYGKGVYGYGYPGSQLWPNVSRIIFIVLSLFFFFKVKFWKKQPQVFILFVVWMGTYVLCVTNFNPGNADYWYQHLITIFILIAYSFSEFLKDKDISLLIRKTVLGLFLCSIVIIPPINFFDSIYPISRVEDNENYMKAIWVKKHVEKGGVVIISGIGWNPGKVYIPSFANVGRISFDLIFVYNTKAQGLQLLKNQVEMIASQGMNMYALDEIFGKLTEEGLKRWKVTMDEIKEIFKYYEFKTLGVYKDGMKIMQVFPKKGSAAYQRREGIKFYNLKEYNKSVDEFLRIPENDKTGLDYKLIGNCYILTNNSQKALPYWEKALQINPSDAELRQLLQHYKNQ